MSKNCHHNASVACEVIAFSKIEDDRGHLSVLEGSEQIPFDVNRVFFVANPQSSRGNHAHKSLWELLIPIAGSLDVLVDNGTSQKTFHLKEGTEGLLIPPLNWTQQTNFSSDCIYLVLASQKYSESDYLRNYSEFLEITRAA